MNKSGCKDPVAERAISHETKRERLRKKYKVKEGDVIKIFLPVRDNERTENKTVKVRIREIHTNIITVILPSGLLENFTWWNLNKEEGDPHGLTGSLSPVL